MCPELERLAYNAEERNHHIISHLVQHGKKKKLAKFIFLVLTKVCIPLNCAFIWLGIIKCHGKQYNLRVTSERTGRLGVDF